MYSSSFGKAQKLHVAEKQKLELYISDLEEEFFGGQMPNAIMGNKKRIK